MGVTVHGFGLYTNAVICRPAVLKVRARMDCQQSRGRRGRGALGERTRLFPGVAGGLRRASPGARLPSSEGQGCDCFYGAGCAGSSFALGPGVGKPLLSGLVASRAPREGRARGRPWAGEPCSEAGGERSCRLQGGPPLWPGVRRVASVQAGTTSRVWMFVYRAEFVHCRRGKTVD